MRAFGLRAAAAVGAVAAAREAAAGMPAPLPSDWETVSRLTDSAHARVQAISFFLVGLLATALIVQLLWRMLRRDFPQLPRLRFGGALAAVVLWGLLFVIVLTMISGARELMTPGAWEKRGLTYRLAEDRPEESATVSGRAAREERLELLRTELLRYAAQHEGRFPSDEADLPADLRTVPGAGDLRYRFVPGRSAAETGRVLAYEPEVEHDARLVLTTDGEIRTLTNAELSGALAEASP